MRILQVNKYRSGGGVEKYMNQLVSFFRNQGNIVDVLTVNTSLRKNIRIFENGKVIELPRLFEYSSAAVSLSFPCTLGKIGNNYDIIHFHYPNPIGEVSCLLSCNFVNTPKLVTFHNDVAKEKKFSKLYNYIARKFLERMEIIIVTSPNLAQSSKVLKALDNKVKIIPLGVDAIPCLDGVRRNPETEEKWQFPIILFVGRLAKVKGLNYLISAMTEVQGELWIAGEGPLKEELMKLTGSLNLADKVKFLGYVSNDKLLELYKVADIFVLPSVYRGEGFGYVLLEAMINKTALISTELGTGTSWVNQDGKTGFVIPPRDPNAIVDAVKKLAENREELDRYKENAYERAISQFTIDNMLYRIQDEYNAIYSGKTCVERL